jgi:hypothetical protein
MAVVFVIILVKLLSAVQVVPQNKSKPGKIVRRGVQGMALFRFMKTISQKPVCTTVAFLWQRFPRSILPPVDTLWPGKQGVRTISVYITVL